MSLSGSTALARVATNPGCPIQVAMCLSGRPENKFYESVTGEPFMGEFGERQSARRRGSQFEKNLFSPPGDARLLREALAPIAGVEPDDFHVRDLEQEVPGTTQDVRVTRLKRTRNIIADALRREGRPVLVVQPQLLVPTQPGQRPYFFVAPDYMVWVPDRGVFLPGDAKSFVVRDNVVDESDLERTRLQMASQVVGLRHEFARHDRGHLVTNEGLLICATPYALKPTAPSFQDLSGAVVQVARAIDCFVQHRDRIIALNGGTHLQVQRTIDALEPNFRESCVSTCAMASYCRRQLGECAHELGDAAVRLFGADGDIGRLVGLMKGDVQPDGPAEERLAADLRSVAQNVDPEVRRVA